MRIAIPVLALSLILLGCDSSTGPGSKDRVEVRFQAATATAPTGFSVNPGVSPGMPNRVPVQGTNGTLELEGVWMIVAEFEVHGDGFGGGGNCPGTDEDDCHEFESRPFFVELPLEDGSVSVATDQIPPGSYDRFSFEIEDLNDEDEDDGQGASEIMGQIRASFLDWPEEASILVEGTFTPTGGEPQPFRVYMNAEIEIERALNPPLNITDDGNPDAQAIMVQVDPWAWFQRSDGTVWDLSEYDFGRTGQLLELDGEIEQKFGHIEVEDDR